MDPLDPFNILDFNEGARMVLHYAFHVRIVDGRHPLNVLRSSHQSIKMDLESISDQVRVIYISREDASCCQCARLLFSATKTTLALGNVQAPQAIHRPH